MNMPPSLSSEEFCRRAEALRREGRPVTLGNLHPELFEYYDSRWRRQRRRKALCFLAVIVATAIAILAPAFIALWP